MSKRLNELTVFGFINENCIYSLPITIIKLCVLFFDEIFLWPFEGKQLKKFRSSILGDYIEGPSMVYNKDLFFCCIVWPKGVSMCSYGYIQFQLAIDYMSERISYCIVSFTLHCIETETNFIGLMRFNKSHSDCAVQGFSYQLPFDECKNLTKLTFKCVINEVYIKYNKKCDYKILYYPSKSSVKLKSFQQFKWKINKILLNKFKLARNQERFISPSFGNWCFDITPNGATKWEIGQFRIAITMIRWPYNTKSIKTRFKLTVNSEKQIKYKYDEMFEFDMSKQKRLLLFSNKSRFLNSELNDDAFSFDVKITILAVYDENNKEIKI